MEDLNIRHFKLTSGEELIGLVQHSDENAFVLERPVQIKMNSLGMYMYSPWFPFSDKKIYKLFKRKKLLRFIETKTYPFNKLNIAISDFRKGKILRPIIKMNH